MKWSYRRVYELPHIMVVFNLGTNEVIDVSIFLHLSQRLQKFLGLPKLDIKNKTLIER